jgi:hypothetical protein
VGHVDDALEPSSTARLVPFPHDEPNRVESGTFFRHLVTIAQKEGVFCAQRHHPSARGTPTRPKRDGVGATGHL